MKPVILTDTAVREQLFPFAEIRAVADIRIGIMTIREKWEALLQQQVILDNNIESIQKDEAEIYPANIIPSRAFVEAIRQSSGEKQHWEDVKVLQYPWQLFEWNDWALRQDFEILTRERFSAPIPETVQVSHARDIFIEPGAKLSHCMLNASTGPIYIGSHAEVMEGALIRGPFALCEGSVVKMGAKIYGATTVGPYCTVGGEIKNSILLGYSNKAHDGYLGDAVIGEWCNLGAGTSNSNIKNTASPVKVWHGPAKDYIVAGLKCGLLMGDYSRCAINTAFNTGTVTGICANIFGEGLTPKYIPSFTWGGKGLSKYEFQKALQDIEKWKKLKNQSLQEAEIKQLKHIFDQP